MIGSVMCWIWRGWGVGKLSVHDVRVGERVEGLLYSPAAEP